jgi:hypothetical protein
MFTTAGETVRAMVRKVTASTGPEMGAELAAGTASSVCAADCDGRSNRGASTMPTASPATAKSAM